MIRFEAADRKDVQPTVFMFSNSLKYDSFCCMLSARSTSSDCKVRTQQTSVDTKPHYFNTIPQTANLTYICEYKQFLTINK